MIIVNHLHHLLLQYVNQKFSCRLLLDNIFVISSAKNFSQPISWSCSTALMNHIYCGKY